MQVLKISNGEVRNGYSLSELTRAVQCDVVVNHRPKLACGADDYNDDMAVVEMIQERGLLFDIEGNKLPLLFHISNGVVTHLTYGKAEHTVTIETI